MKKRNFDMIISEKSYIDLDWRKIPVSGEANELTSFLGNLIYESRPLVSRIGKRFVDIAGASIGIILTLPLMLIIAIAIKLTSKGPVIFRQKRMGHLGRKFTFLKFRTMRIDGDDSIHKEYVRKLIRGEKDGINMGKEGEPLYKLSKDYRVTRLGHILRITSLDELPQFFNVLAGSMSLVGPRPPITYEVESYKNWHWRRMIEAKPGITGIWQVSGRSRTTYDDMVRLDLNYARNQSILLDLKIIAKTFSAVLNMDGAL
ncbi:MAG: sugar transferase [Candidatus Glassbacteria bacterium]